MGLDIRNENFSLSDFTGFSFGDLRVGMEGGLEWRGFIVNEGGLSMTGGPEFEDEFAGPTFGNKQFLMGTTELQKEFNFEVVLIEIRKGNLKRFIREIRARKVDLLRFDFNRNYGWNVKVGSVVEMEYDPVGKCEDGEEILFNVRLGLNFVTVGD